jgi:hypothetical protein
VNTAPDQLIAKEQFPIVESFEQIMKQLKEISGFIRYVEVLKAMCDNLAIFVKEFGIDIESEYQIQCKLRLRF